MAARGNSTAVRAAFPGSSRCAARNPYVEFELLRPVGSVPAARAD